MLDRRRLDRDADSMSDALERKHSPCSDLDPRVDLDGDGFENTEEMRRESDPLDRNNRPE